MIWLGRIIACQWRHAPGAFLLGLVVALVPALAGIALLGVAGWFITACAFAGLAGVALNIFLPSALIRGLAVARTLGRYGERLLTHDATFRFLTDLRKQVFQGQAASHGDGSRPARSGAALNRLTSDIAALDAVYLRLVVPAFLSAVTGILVLAWAFALAPLAIAGLACLVLWTVCLSVYLVRYRDMKSTRRQEAALEALRLRNVDLVAGRRDLAVYGGLEGSAAGAMHAEARLSDATETIDARTARLLAMNSLTGQVFLGGTLLVACLLMANGILAPAWGIALILVALAVPEVLGGLVPGLANLQRTQLAAGRAVIGTGRTGADAPHVGNGPQSVDETGPAGKPVLAFDKVTFAYPRAETPVLVDFSLEIGRGEVLALTGRSGCGKSTVSGLAARLLRPHGGAIELLGRPLESYAEDDLRKTVTVLGQKPHLFNDTVAANLRIANPSASEQDLWAALDNAALGARIRNSEAGLQSVLGEGGVGLSGGEQRRLGLARAYLTRPALFILDEMTEGLDDRTAEDVLNRFEAFRGDAAVLMIAHKSQEIRRADRVLGLSEREHGLAAE
jgi:ATP-binding cassette subfamily C protein CydC